MRVLQRSALWAGLLLLAVLGSDPAAGTTYVLLRDAALLEQADRVVEVTVLKRLPATHGGGPESHHLALVTGDLEGQARPTTLVLATPGGRDRSGMELFVPGVPRFKTGDRALLFLVERRDGVYEVLHWALGAFFLRQGPGRVLAVRGLDEAMVLDRRGERAEDLVRDYGRFWAWLEDLARDVERRPDYFVSPSPSFKPAYNLMRSGGQLVRWFEFDTGGRVDFKFRSSGSAGSVREFDDALAEWGRKSSVSLYRSGSTSSTRGFKRSDGINAIIFGDPNKEVPGKFDCDTGGVLGAGGFYRSRTLQSYGSKKYYPILEGDIVINDGAGCVLGIGFVAGELFAHELGHTLGIGHSCGDSGSGPCSSSRENDATMRAFLHGDGRGADLKADDESARRRLYSASAGGGGGDPTPDPTIDAPSDLAARATSPKKGKLTWKDNSKNESGFEVQVMEGNGPWQVLGTRRANSTKMEFRNATPGARYTFRVRAIRGGARSEFSETASVKMPPLITVKKPSGLVARAASPTTVELTWRDNSNNERTFEIFIKVGEADWERLTKVGANVTDALVENLTPGETYRFKVRARKEKKLSKFSNVRTVTMPSERP